MAPTDSSLEHAAAGPAVRIDPLAAARASLSARLLQLTVAFVMVAEVAVFAPIMSAFRADYLRAKLADAHLILTALEASSSTRVDPQLRDLLLGWADMRGMTALRPGMPPRTLGPRMPRRIPKLYDLRTAMFWDLVADAFMTMARKGDQPFGVTGFSPLDQNVIIEAVLDEQPLRTAMWDYARRLLVISLIISVITAALVYGTLQWLLVRPLRRLTASMVSFQTAPEDASRIIQPEGRTDEVGVAEQALSDMQRQLRASLLQRARLAGVGTAVTKISHDLKNILATAMLESDRLERSSDPEIKRVTSGLVRAVDRAAKLATSTLRFAKEGPPQVTKQPLKIVPFLADVRAAVQPGLRGCEIEIAPLDDFAFDGDFDLLLRAFENLLRNACEAGGTTATLSAALENGAHIVRISDNGPGLLPKAFDHLFEPFAGSTRANGAGLGLPIARELLRAQGGDVRLESTSPTGAVFVVRLPP